MHINNVFANNSKIGKCSFLLKHQVCLFNSRISKTVWAHFETSLKTSHFLQCIFAAILQRLDLRGFPQSNYVSRYSLQGRKAVKGRALGPRCMDQVLHHFRASENFDLTRSPIAGPSVKNPPKIRRKNCEIDGS